jgi:hypothetical protein
MNGIVTRNCGNDLTPLDVNDPLKVKYEYFVSLLQVFFSFDILKMHVGFILIFRPDMSGMHMEEFTKYVCRLNRTPPTGNTRNKPTISGSLSKPSAYLQCPSHLDSN